MTNNMKTLQEIKQEAREEFYKNFTNNCNFEAVGENVMRGGKFHKFFEETLDRLVDEIEKAVDGGMKNPYRPHDKEFYNDTHRTTGYLSAKGDVRDAFARFKGESVTK